MVILLRRLGSLRLPVPHGTCYLAEEPLAALLEVTRGLTILSEDFLTGRRLLTATLTVEMRVAELMAAGAYGFDGIACRVPALGRSPSGIPQRSLALLR